MNAKEINSFLNQGIKQFQHQNDDKKRLGIAYKKDFSGLLQPIFQSEELEVDEADELEDDMEHPMQLEILSYLENRINQDRPHHDLILDLQVQSEDVYSYWFLFMLSPYFSCHTLTLGNVIKYKISTQDPFFQEIFNYLGKFYSTITDYLDHFELDDWFLADLHRKI